MPRQTQKRIKGTQRVREQDTFDFSQPRRTVSARPTDNYVQPTQDNSSSNLLKFANQLEEIGNKGSSLYRAYQDEQRKAGETAALRGDEVEEDASAAFIEGHEGIAGQAAVAGYRRDLDEIYQKQYTMAPDEWQAAVEDINQKYLNGASDSYLRGFAPGALNVENSYNEKYANQQRKMIQDEFKLNMSNVVNENVFQVLDDDSIANTDKPKVLREQVTRMQEKGKQYNLSRNEVNDVIIGSIGELAVQHGRPDFMLFAQVPDKDGFKLTSNPENASKVRRYMDMAEREMESRNVEANAKIKAADKAKHDEIEKGIIDGIRGEDMKQARALVRKHRAILTPEEYDKYLTRIDKSVDDSMWQKESDPIKYREYYNLASDGALTNEDFEEMNGYLTFPEYKEMIKLNAKGQNPVSWRTALNEYKKTTVRKMTPTNDFGFSTEPDREQEIIHQFNLYAEHWDQENPGKAPSPSELMKWSKEVESYLGIKTGKTQASNGMFTAGGFPDANQSTPSATAPAKTSPAPENPEKPFTKTVEEDPVMGDDPIADLKKRFQAIQ